MNQRAKGQVDPVIATAIQKMVDDAYANGFNQGLLTARSGLDALLTSYVPNMAAEAADKPANPERRSKNQAGRDGNVPKPRGVAAAAIKSVFEREQGLNTSSIHRKAAELGHELSLEAVGAELRRHEGRKYRRDGKRVWFPIMGTKESAADPQSDMTENPPQTEHQSSAENISDAPMHQPASRAA